MSASGMGLLVGRLPRRRRSRVMELCTRLQEALVEEFSPNHASLTVIASGGVLRVRGEVGSLDQISRATRVIARFCGKTEIVNLVRVRASTITAQVD
jgi:hypothetical protein